ncbi:MULTISPECIES: hypothetical protein [unclassified Streptomyces]|uniref:hypothetical protein n=1 Tax=unclassified Streptomyces TaxID=2593676 RepID=UPI00081E21FF|nr:MULTISPECIES: hypothetical protein [unclassified Streptomyces]MYR97971.1 hypothetical protein [Streptomyces sp. SID4937]SCE32377.1 hypothetical protein GA0115243_110647 [Streptomyces sp. ScaeMP-e83]
MTAVRRRSEHWNAPPTWRASPTFDRHRVLRPGQSAALVTVALFAAAVGVFALATWNGNTPSAATATEAAVTKAVREELHAMFLADIASRGSVLRSSLLQEDAAARIDYPGNADTLALRCYGAGRLRVARILTDGTSEAHPEIRCGDTTATYIVNDGTLRTIVLRLDGAGTWASWALTRPTSPTGAPGRTTL